MRSESRHARRARATVTRNMFGVQARTTFLSATSGRVFYGTGGEGGEHRRRIE
jgi:hypothetical protein